MLKSRGIGRTMKRRIGVAVVLLMKMAKILHLPQIIIEGDGIME